MHNIVYINKGKSINVWVVTLLPLPPGGMHLTWEFQIGDSAKNETDIEQSRDAAHKFVSDFCVVNTRGPLVQWTVMIIGKIVLY